MKRSTELGKINVRRKASHRLDRREGHNTFLDRVEFAKPTARFGTVATRGYNNKNVYSHKELMNAIPVGIYGPWGKTNPQKRRKKSTLGAGSYRDRKFACEKER